MLRMHMKLPIVLDPNPMLRARAKEIPAAEISTPAFQKLVDDMIETMYASNGIGIAGPQVGESRRLIIAEQGEHNPIALVNPVIISKSFGKVNSEEGCLSVPGMYGTVRRYKAVKARALDRNGKPVEIQDDTLFAIILQHEIDHLDGILFIDKAGNIQKITLDFTPKI